MCLQKESHILAEQEKQKPDSEYLMEDGKLPLPNGILYNNELWKVGKLVSSSTLDQQLTCFR
jgi:chromatin structure-remodeling complex subunit RSC1/2